jgi:hypothetical protein
VNRRKAVGGAVSFFKMHVIRVRELIVGYWFVFFFFTFSVCQNNFSNVFLRKYHRFVCCLKILRYYDKSYPRYDYFIKKNTK